MRLFALACALGVFLASMQAQGTGKQPAATQPDLGNQTATGKGRSQTTKGGAANAGQPKQGKGGGAAPGKSDTPSTKSYYLEDICSLATASQVSCLRVGTAAAQPIPTPTLPTPVTPDNCHRTHAQTVVNSTAVNTQLGGAPSPFKVTPVGPFLYIYSSTTPPASGGIPTADQKGLAALEHSIADVAAASQGFTEELPVANAVALGNSVAASLQAIAPAGIKVTTTGTATIQATSDGTVSCAAFSQLLKDFTNSRRILRLTLRWRTCFSWIRRRRRRLLGQQRSLTHRAAQRHCRRLRHPQRAELLVLLGRAARRAAVRVVERGQEPAPVQGLPAAVAERDPAQVEGRQRRAVRPREAQPEPVRR